MTELHPSESAVGAHMDELTEICALAQRYYEEEGRPEGHSLEHWLRAERVIHAESSHPAEQVRTATEADLRTEESMHLGR